MDNKLSINSPPIMPKSTANCNTHQFISSVEDDRMHPLNIAAQDSSSMAVIKSPTEATRFLDVKPNLLPMTITDKLAQRASVKNSCNLMVHNAVNNRCDFQQCPTPPTSIARQESKVNVHVSIKRRRGVSTSAITSAVCGIGSMAQDLSPNSQTSSTMPLMEERAENTSHPKSSGHRQRNSVSASLPDTWSFAGDLSMDHYLKEKHRKESHNLVEQRRRNHINAQMLEMQKRLPKECFEDIRDGRISQGQILSKAVDYIEKQRSYVELQRAWHMVMETISPLLELIQELEQKAASLNLPVPGRNEELLHQMNRLVHFVQNTQYLEEQASTSMSSIRQRSDSGVGSQLHEIDSGSFKEWKEEEVSDVMLLQHPRLPVTVVTLDKGSRQAQIIKTSLPEEMELQCNYISTPNTSAYSNHFAEIDELSLHQEVSDFLMESATSTPIGGTSELAPDMSISLNETSPPMNSAYPLGDDTGVADFLTDWDLNDLMDI